MVGAPPPFSRLFQVLLHFAFYPTTTSPPFTSLRPSLVGIFFPFFETFAADRGRIFFLLYSHLPPVFLLIIPAFYRFPVQQIILFSAFPFSMLFFLVTNPSASPPAQLDLVARVSLFSLPFDRVSPRLVPSIPLFSAFASTTQLCHLFCFPRVKASS